MVPRTGKKAGESGEGAGPGGDRGEGEAVRVDWRSGVGLLVTAVLLWWVFRGVDLPTVIREVRGADYVLFGLAVAITTGGFALRTARWGVLLRPLHRKTRFHPRFAAVNIGFMANNLLPLRVGEFARAYALSRLEPVSAGSAFGSLAVERFLDVLTIIALMLVAITAPDFPEGATVAGRPVARVVGGMGLLLAGLLAALLILLIWPRRLVRLAERWLARLVPEPLGRRLVEGLEAFLTGLVSLRSPRLLALALLWSAILWTWHSLAFWIGFRAFGIEASYFAALFLNAIVAFAVAVPSSPGFFGTFHAGVMVALVGVYGTGSGQTLAFAFGFHLGGFVPVTLLGLFYLWRLGLSFEEIERSEKRVEEELEELAEGVEEAGGAS